MAAATDVPLVEKKRRPLSAAGIRARNFIREAIAIGTLNEILWTASNEDQPTRFSSSESRPVTLERRGGYSDKIGDEDYDEDPADHDTYFDERSEDDEHEQEAWLAQLTDDDFHSIWSDILQSRNLFDVTVPIQEVTTGTATASNNNYTEQVQHANIANNAVQVVDPGAEEYGTTVPINLQKLVGDSHATKKFLHRHRRLQADLLQATRKRNRLRKMKRDAAATSKIGSFLQEQDEQDPILQHEHSNLEAPKITGPHTPNPHASDVDPDLLPLISSTVDLDMYIVPSLSAQSSKAGGSFSAFYYSTHTTREVGGIGVRDDGIDIDSLADLSIFKAKGVGEEKGGRRALGSLIHVYKNPGYDLDVHDVKHILGLQQGSAMGMGMGVSVAPDLEAYTRARESLYHNYVPKLDGLNKPVLGATKRQTMLQRNKSSATAVAVLCEKKKGQGLKEEDNREDNSQEQRENGKEEISTLSKPSPLPWSKQYAPGELSDYDYGVKDCDLDPNIKNPNTNMANTIAAWTELMAPTTEKLVIQKRKEIMETKRRETQEIVAYGKQVEVAKTRTKPASSTSGCDMTDKDDDHENLLSLDLSLSFKPPQSISTVAHMHMMPGVGKEMRERLISHSGQGQGEGDENSAKDEVLSCRSLTLLTDVIDDVCNDKDMHTGRGSKSSSPSPDRNKELILMNRVQLGSGISLAAEAEAEADKRTGKNIVIHHSKLRSRTGKDRSSSHSPTNKHVEIKIDDETNLILADSDVYVRYVNDHESIAKQEAALSPRYFIPLEMRDPFVRAGFNYVPSNSDPSYSAQTLNKNKDTGAVVHGIETELFSPIRVHTVKPSIATTPIHAHTHTHSHSHANVFNIAKEPKPSSPQAQSSEAMKPSIVISLVKNNCELVNDDDGANEIENENEDKYGQETEDNFLFQSIITDVSHGKNKYKNKDKNQVVELDLGERSFGSRDTASPSPPSSPTNTVHVHAHAHAHAHSSNHGSNDTPFIGIGGAVYVDIDVENSMAAMHAESRGEGGLKHEKFSSYASVRTHLQDIDTGNNKDSDRDRDSNSWHKDKIETKTTRGTGEGANSKDAIFRELCDLPPDTQATITAAIKAALNSDISDVKVRGAGGRQNNSISPRTRAYTVHNHLPATATSTAIDAATATATGAATIIGATIATTTAQGTVPLMNTYDDYIENDSQVILHEHEEASKRPMSQLLPLPLPTALPTPISTPITSRPISAQSRRNSRYKNTDTVDVVSHILERALVCAESSSEAVYVDAENGLYDDHNHNHNHNHDNDGDDYDDDVPESPSACENKNKNNNNASTKFPHLEALAEVLDGQGGQEQGNILERLKLLSGNQNKGIVRGHRNAHITARASRSGSPDSLSTAWAYNIRYDKNNETLLTPHPPSSRGPTVPLSTTISIAAETGTAMISAEALNSQKQEQKDVNIQGEAVLSVRPTASPRKNALLNLNSLQKVLRIREAALRARAALEAKKGQRPVYVPIPPTENLPPRKIGAPVRRMIIEPEIEVIESPKRGLRKKKPPKAFLTEEEDEVFRFVQEMPPDDLDDDENYEGNTLLVDSNGMRQLFVPLLLEQLTLHVNIGSSVNDLQAAFDLTKERKSSLHFGHLKRLYEYVFISFPDILYCRAGNHHSERYNRAIEVEQKMHEFLLDFKKKNNENDKEYSPEKVKWSTIYKHRMQEIVDSLIELQIAAGAYRTIIYGVPESLPQEMRDLWTHALHKSQFEFVLMGEPTLAQLRECVGDVRQ